ncbi:hypothetical protein J4E08_10420 [Sagittula sp. NFXS13]|uniref:hypothetical protein n=1 Tax=Sagittula sp. NFXS13 TaxID=2819095 RepID=UPI0032DFB397
MDTKGFIFAVGGLVVGLIGGTVIGNGMSDTAMQDAISRTIQPAREEASNAATSTQATLATIQEQLTALEAAVTGNTVDPEEMASSMGEQTQGLSEQIKEMRDALSSQISEAGASQAEAVQAAMDELSSSMANSAQIAASAVASSDGGSGGGAMPSDDMEVSDALSVGSTALFADGALRVFVSRLEPEQGSARLSVNRETVNLGTGGTTTVSVEETECALSIMALTSQGVTLGSDCSAVLTDAEDAAQSSDDASDQPENTSEEDAAASDDTNTDSAQEDSNADSAQEEPDTQEESPDEASSE